MTDESLKLASLSATLKVAQVILIPLAAWLAVEVWGMHSDLARVEERLGYIEATQGRILGRIDLVADDVATELRPDLASVTEQTEKIAEHGDRIARLARRVDLLREENERVTVVLSSLSEYVERRVPGDTTDVDSTDAAWKDFIRNPRRWDQQNND